MVLMYARQPVSPCRGRNGQIVAEDVEGERLQLVERLDGNVGDRVPGKVARQWLLSYIVHSRQNIPSLVGEGVVIQPFVCQHTSQKDEPEWSVRLNGIPVVAQVRLPQ